MKKIGNWLLGDAKETPFEHRMFHFALILGIVMTLFGALIDFSWTTGVYILFAFSALWILLYHLSRFKGYFKQVSVISFSLLVFLFVPYAWIFTGGSYGMFPFYAMTILAIMSIILRGRVRIVLVVALITLLWLMVQVDRTYYEVIPFYHQLESPHIASTHYLMVLLVMAALLLTYSMTYMREKERGETYAKTIEETYQQQLYYMENLESLIDKLKSERHDFNHHLGVVYGLLSGHEDQKATSYVKRLVAEAEEYQSVVNIPYSMIRAMLNYKLSSAKDAGIDLKLDILVPEQLNLNEYDLTLLLGNLLDNAIEACSALEGQSRVIAMHLNYKPDYLVIQIENPMKEDVFPPQGKRPTTKADGDNHGFGLKNIQYLVDKHHGFMKIEAEQGIFRVNIALLVEV